LIHHFELNEYLAKLKIGSPKLEQFNKLVDTLSYFKSEDTGEIINLNYERGYLLYSLIMKTVPDFILEFGTGIGFGTFSMVLALNDMKSTSKLFTIDLTKPSEKILRYYVKDNQIQSRIISRNQLWENIAESSWMEKLESFTGYSSEILLKNKFPKIQFFYIDGAHFYEGVKYDFLSALQLADSEAYFLFDDYIDRPSYGVKQLIDKEIANIFDIDLISTDRSRYFINKGVTKTNYGMCFLKLNRDSMIDAFGKKNIDEFIKKYETFEKRLKFRNKMNEKIPLLKKIRFRNIINK
jgi:predicted O-methyltransferase YrrM